MTEVRVIDLEPDLEVMSGYAVTVEFEGKTYKVEQWATDNSSGTEVYDEGGAPLYGDNVPDEIIEWEMDEDPRVQAFWARWETEVGPLVDRIKAEVFGPSA